MPIRFACPQCGHKISAREERAGTKGKCAQCGAVLTIPSAQAASGTGTPSPSASGSSQPDRESSQRIKIRCPKCSGEMRAPLQLAGKVSKCPHCGVALKIPQPPAKKRGSPPAAGPRQQPAEDLSAGLTPLDDASGLTPLDDLSDLTPLDDPLGSAASIESTASAGGSPFGGGPGASGGSFAGGAYQSPSAYTSRKRSGGGSANLVVLLPAIAMIVMASLTIVGGIFNIVQMATGAAADQVMRDIGPGPGAEVGRNVAMAVVIVIVVLALIKSLLVILGSVKMIRRESWGLALTASILCMLPCNLCCFIELPIGIWAVIVLSQAHIRNSFG